MPSFALILKTGEDVRSRRLTTAVPSLHEDDDGKGQKRTGAGEGHKLRLLWLFDTHFARATHKVGTFGERREKCEQYGVYFSLNVSHFLKGTTAVPLAKTLGQVVGLDCS